MKSKVLEVITSELNYQTKKAIQNNWKTNKGPIEYAVLMEAEIAEAKQGYCKNDTSNFGRNRTEHEILQTVCLGIEMLSNLSDEQLESLMESTKKAFDYYLVEKV